MWNSGGRRWRVDAQTICLFTMLKFTLAAFILALIAQHAGQSPHHLQRSAIVTFDTSAVRADVQVYDFVTGSTESISTPQTNIYDWYEMHFLSVCKGMWLGGEGAPAKDESTTQCEGKPSGYTFSLSHELAADAPSAAQALFANWSYGDVATEASAVLLIIAECFMSQAIVGYLYHLIMHPTIEPGAPLAYLRVTFLANVVAAIVMTHSASQITAKASDLTDLSDATLPVSLNAWKPDGFYVIIWLSVALTYCSMITGIVLSVFIKKSIRGKKSWCGCRDSSSSPEPIKEEF